MQRHLELQILLTSQKDLTGYIVVTAQFKKAEVAKRSVTINVAIDPEKANL